MGVIIGTAASFVLLIATVAVLLTVATSTFSSEQLAIADEVYAPILQQCIEITHRYADAIIDIMRNNTKKSGAISEVILFPKVDERCGARHRDQLSAITTILCNATNDLVVVCNADEVEVRTRQADQAKDEIIRLYVEYRLSKSQICNCVAAELNLPKPPLPRDTQSTK